MNITTRWLFGLPLFLVGLLLGCGGGSDDNDPPERRQDLAALTALTVTPQNPTVDTGTQLQLAATGQFAEGGPEDISTLVAWTSSDGAILAVDNSGLVSALAPGNATVTATANGIASSTNFTIVGPILVGLTLEPGNPTIANGTRTRLTAHGNFADGSARDLTRLATWASSNPAVATVNNEAAAKGVVTSTGPGTSVITASFGDIPGNTTLNVVTVALNQLSVRPENPTLLKGTTVGFQAMGHFEGGLSQDLTDQVTWSTSDTGIITVSSDPASAGQVTAIETGTALVSAVFAGTTGTSNVGVVDTQLLRLEITPIRSRLATGTGAPLKATGIFADGSVRDMTGQVDWSSANDTIAAIDTSGNRGFVTAAQAGTASISAHFAGIETATDLTVTDARLLGLQVLPNDATLAIGTRLGFRAIGSFADGTTQDVTSLANWSSLDGNVAAITSRSDQIEVQGKAAGTTKVIASFGGKPAYATLQVNDAALTSVEITPPSLTLATGTRSRLTANARFADGSMQEVTTAASWSSSDTSIVNVTSQGEISALQPGSATISTGYGGASTSATITVSDATLQSIAVTPANPSLAAGAAAQMSATGTFSDASTRDLTGQALWVSDNNGVVSVSNAGDSSGLATAMGAGTATVTAGFGGIQGGTTVTVTQAPAAPVSLAVVATPNFIRPGGDVSTLRVIVRAAEAGAQVADGTAVQFRVISGPGQLGSAAATTQRGEATTTLTASGPGAILVEALAAGTGISGVASLHANSDFTQALAPGGFDRATVENGIVQAGARFGFFLVNLTNRIFGLDRFEFSNGSTVVVGRTDPAVLSDNDLTEGEGIGIIVGFDTPQSDNGFTARYVLSDTITQQSFDVTRRFDLANPADTVTP